MRVLTTLLVATLLVAASCGGGDDGTTNGGTPTNSGTNSGNNSGNNTNSGNNSDDNSGINTDPGTCTADDLVPQASCNGGFKCTVVSTSGEVQCVEEGLLDFYDQCTPVLQNEANQDDCPKGAMCAEGREGYQCLPFCKEKNIPCAQGGVCLLSEPYLPQGTYLCAPPIECDPLSNAGCAQDHTCYILVEYGSMTACTADAGTGEQGDTCTTAFDCAPGFTCVSSGPDKRCARLCTSDSQCSSYGSTFRCAIFDHDRNLGICH